MSSMTKYLLLAAVTAANLLLAFYIIWILRYCHECLAWLGG